MIDNYQLSAKWEVYGNICWRHWMFGISWFHPFVGYAGVHLAIGPLQAGVTRNGL